MSNRRFPILIWNQHEAGWAATLVGDLESATASGATEAEALRQLKDLIEWRFANEPWNADPDLIEPSLIEMKVQLRPCYASRRRVIPCPETICVRVPCVVGRQESGSGLCDIPHLSIQFNFHDRSTLNDLVVHSVKDVLQRLTPAALLLRLPPMGCRLDELVVRIPGDRARQVPPEEREELKVLFNVADPLLMDRSRQRGSPTAYGRDPLVNLLVAKLGTRKTNVLLVGEPGVGKSTVLFEAVKRLARQPRTPSSPGDAGRSRPGERDDDTAGDLRKYRHWRSSGSRLIAGMRYLGEWEERCEKFVEQLAAIDGMFCAENLLELVSVGGQSPGDSVGAFLLPYLQRAELRIVAESTPQELEACRRLLPGLLEAFQVLPVPVLDDATAARVLDQIVEALTTSSKIDVERGAVALVHRLFQRFQPYAAFPGPAAAFARRLCTTARPAKSGAAAAPLTLTRAEVVRAFVQQTGLPELFLRDELPLVTEELREQFAERIIGQPDATGVAARLVATIKAGLTDPGRPPGVLLFCGPTGVGKTALARLLAEYCFGAGNDGERSRDRADSDRLVRLDMSEYSGWGAALRLLQNPQGQPAHWIERVRQQPFCVVLLDEIEKAAPEIFDVLLSLLDEGRLTDRYGRITWFRSALIILTSNLGASAAGAPGFVPPADGGYAAAVSKFFRPEFFNRLDAVVTFKPLARAEVERIALKELNELAAREGLSAAGLRLQWSERLVAAVAAAGYDHQLGARPLQRALERLLVTPLSRWKVAHPTVRNCTLHLDFEDGSVSVTAA